jgi:hypothetical protein
LAPGEGRGTERTEHRYVSKCPAERKRYGQPPATAATLADLRKSGLSDATIAAGRFYSLESPASAQDIRRWTRYDGQLGPCLCIPFADAEGRRG